MNAPGRSRWDGHGRPVAVASLALTLLATSLTGSAVAQELRVSPGPLSRAHAKLEGITSCERCHEVGQGVSAARCLSCHEAIASRIAARKGVHRAVTDDCTRCHREHGGVDADLRRLDVQSFDHLTETGFALAGQHAKLAAKCEACHKQRSFLAAGTECQSCHADPHKRALGETCTRCHSIEVPFKDARRGFDHTAARFNLTGAHRSVACEKCHVAGAFKGLRFDRCSACHATPHRANFQDDCRSCHEVTSFRNATFDHSRTGFPLAARHARPACRECHTSLSSDDVPRALKVLDFSGLSPVCHSCHKDPHKGRFGQRCDTCHVPTMTFKVADFVHPRSPEFFSGQHRGVACEKCHVRTTAAVPVRSPPPGETAAPMRPTTACSTCHTDVHLGQVGTACERCHGVEAPRFAPNRFSHETAAFPLTGKHQKLECKKCHPSQTAVFPAGAGTARRLAPLSRECLSCHKDPHLGQIDGTCATCHSTATFELASYAHRGEEATFRFPGHEGLRCKKCHRVETGQFPAGFGTALRLKVGRRCIDCHPK